MHNNPVRQVLYFFNINFRYEKTGIQRSLSNFFKAIGNLMRLPISIVADPVSQPKESDMKTNALHRIEMVCDCSALFMIIYVSTPELITVCPEMEQ